MADIPIALDDLWALQEGEGRDARGRDLDLWVPAGDPEYGPYTAYRFAEPNRHPGAGWRTLTPDEIREATEGTEDDRRR